MINIIDEVNATIAAIISENADEFLNSEVFKVRPEYGPEKFYLDKVDGSYDSSLQNLIHHILHQDEHYELFINARQLEEVEDVIFEDADAIYSPNTWDDDRTNVELQENEIVQENLDEIYRSVITYTGIALSQFEEFDREQFFEESGYSDPDEEDEN